MKRNTVAKKNARNSNGFTLIEVLAGVVIMATGLLLLLPMMVTSIRANNFAQSSTEASMLIKDKMEDLKNMDTPTSGADTLGEVTRTWTVADAGANLTQLAVIVNWNDERGYPHSSSMTSYKSAK
jgi:prepilin-type N-terminal cleavage/methylation domain-containing protein